MLTDAQLLRYNRQLLMHDFDVQGQQRLLDASVLVVGLGGLGSPAAMYLAAAGVGRLRLVDGDVVELSNLQRQIAHRESALGSNKAASVAQAITALNSDTVVESRSHRLSADNAAELLKDMDLVLDATDNYPARFTLNRACIAAGLPLVSAAAVRAEGQLCVFDPHRGGPCYRCLYPQEGAEGALSCSESGVLAPLVGVVGSLQAMEALKLLSGYGDSLRGQLLLLDLGRTDIRRLAVPRRPDCPDCAHLPA